MSNAPWTSWCPVCRGPRCTLNGNKASSPPSWRCCRRTAASRPSPTLTPLGRLPRAGSRRRCEAASPLSSALLWSGRTCRPPSSTARRCRCCPEGAGMDSLLRPLLDAPAWVVYLVSALLIAAETALLPGIVLPTLSTLLLMGFLSERGSLDLWLAFAVASSAALLGDQLAYLEGRYWGPRLRRSRLGRRIGERRWDRAEW